MAGAVAGPSRGPLQSADSITELLTALQGITAVSRFTELSATPFTVLYSPRLQCKHRFTALQGPAYRAVKRCQQGPFTVHYRGPYSITGL